MHLFLKLIFSILEGDGLVSRVEYLFVPLYKACDTIIAFLIFIYLHHFLLEFLNDLLHVLNPIAVKFFPSFKFLIGLLVQLL